MLENYNLLNFLNYTTETKVQEDVDNISFIQLSINFRTSTALHNACSEKVGKTEKNRGKSRPHSGVLGYHLPGKQGRTEVRTSAAKINTVVRPPDAAAFIKNTGDPDGLPGVDLY